MGDGWEIENSSSEKVQSVHSRRRSHDVSQMENCRGDSQELSEFDFDLKSRRRFSGRSDIAHLDAILLSDNQIASLLHDSKHEHGLHQQHLEDNLTSSGAQVKTTESAQESTTVLEENTPLKTNGELDMETERVVENNFSPLKYQSSLFKENKNVEAETFCLRRTVFEVKNSKVFNELSLEGKSNDHESVTSSKRETTNTIEVCREDHISSEITSELQNKPRLHSLQKDTSKRKISFRALVRMKGLGRRMKKKQQNSKKREKFVNNRSESGCHVKEFKSDSSAKYLLESSTSTLEEQTCTQMKLSRHEDQERSMVKSLKRSETLNECKDINSPSLDECLPSSEENVCSLEYLGRRRGALCEELEKRLVCDEQTLADLRAILVVQQKLAGFGLL